MITPMRHVFIVCPCPDRFCGACEGARICRQDADNLQGRQEQRRVPRHAGNDGMVQSPDFNFQAAKGNSDVDRHCEERSDEAIHHPLGEVDCVASQAMTAIS